MTRMFNPGHVLPALDGRTHGVKSLRPMVVQCDDCLTCWEDEMPILAASSAYFNVHVPGVRLCDACWQARGWLYTIRGWEAIA